MLSSHHAPLITAHNPPLNRQLRIPRTPRNPLQKRRRIRPHIRHRPHEPCNRREEVAKQHEDAIQLDHEADERPPQQNQQDARDEGGGAGDLLAAGEEEEGFLEADEEGEAADEEDLFFVCVLGDGVWGRGLGGRTLPIASLWEAGVSGGGGGGKGEGVQGSIEEHHDAGEEEEAACEAKPPRQTSILETFSQKNLYVGGKAVCAARGGMAGGQGACALSLVVPTP